MFVTINIILCATLFATVSFLNCVFGNFIMNNIFEPTWKEVFFGILWTLGLMILAFSSAYLSYYAPYVWVFLPLSLFLGEKYFYAIKGSASQRFDEFYKNKSEKSESKVV